MKLRFYIALWAGKLAMFILKLMGRELDDRPGILMYRICPDFLKYVHKPKYTVAVTGTNGKSTVTALINDVFEAMGKTTSFNKWGANLKAGHCYLMAKSVNFFNKPVVDACVLEADETSSAANMGALKPDTYIVTNISRDSLRRNGHPLYIRDCIQRAISLMLDSRIFLSADDPISCQMNAKHPVYTGLTGGDTGPMPNYRIQDFTVCPRCFKKPVYKEHFYLHVGRFVCPNCGFASPEPDFEGSAFDPSTGALTLTEKDGSQTTLKTGATSIFNAFNYVQVFAYFRSIGVPADQLVSLIEKAHIPASRETDEMVRGIELSTRLCKGQTGSSASTLFEHIVRTDQALELVILVYEEYGNLDAHETISWLYDTDYEFLAKDNVKKIIVCDPNYADYALRLRMAGIDESRFVCISDEKKITDYVTFDGIDRIYVLHECDLVTKGRQVKDEIKKKLLHARLGGGK
ncbi:MAG: DUF1727 domain-containing protein [Firmicutes bacterium]|nr:DUF1727 domain-containing protein [Bacillota bacterium]